MSKGKKDKKEKKRTNIWLATSAEGFLRRVGLTEGQSVLDFGCNKGNYTLPAARIVGDQGRIYAIDKDKKVLRELHRVAKRNSLSNIEFIHVPEDGIIPLRGGLVDIVLLYDVLHRGYLPEVAQRKQVLEKIRQVLKPGGLLSFYPTHIKSYGLTLEKLIREGRNAGFRLRDESRRKLVHDDRLVRGWVLTFRCNIRRT